MKLTFRPQAENDLRWFESYYRKRFPAGKREAERRLHLATQLLLTNPLAGQMMEDAPARRLPILRSPFVLIYTVERDTITILRVWDARADPIRLSEK
jgi:plasmid stabilization system protein ParE